MVISSIHLKNFRNYSDEKIDFIDGINIITGENAQGKTNIVEAVMLCCMGRSPRCQKDKELINFDSEAAQVKSLAISSFGKIGVDIYLTKSDKKRIKVNDIPILKMSELMGNIRAIYFSPDELKLIKESPQDRRRFLDMDLSQLKKKYFHALKRYDTVLNQRNNLLKKCSKQELLQTLEIWDAQMVREGAYLILERSEFCNKMKPFLEKTHKYITDGKENIDISYSSKIDFGDKTLQEIQDDFSKKLSRNIEKDIELRYTTVGPHRDDIKIVVNGVDVRTYGSQGQQRTAALSIKLSELEYFKKESGEYPVLILDDVLSELDDKRKKRLVEYCSVAQTLITATSVDKVLLGDINHRIINIKNGKVIPNSSNDYNIKK